MGTTGITLLLRKRGDIRERETEESSDREANKKKRDLAHREDLGTKRNLSGSLSAAIVLQYSRRRGEELLLPASYTQEDLRSKTKISLVVGKSCEVYASARHRTIRREKQEERAFAENRVETSTRVRGRSLWKHCGYNHISPRFFRAARGSTR